MLRAVTTGRTWGFGLAALAAAGAVAGVAVLASHLTAASTTSGEGAAGAGGQVCSVGIKKQVVRLAFVRDDPLACKQALKLMTDPQALVGLRAEPSRNPSVPAAPGAAALRVKRGSCAEVVQLFLPARNAPELCATVTDVWVAGDPTTHRYSQFTNE